MPNPKVVFYFSASIVLVLSSGLLFYFAYLTPPHQDEAGFWLNCTHPSIVHRFADRNVSLAITPCWHSLTLYLAKLSLPLFGTNGIGLRFPVIAFGIGSLWIIYWFAKRLSGSKEVGVLAAVFFSRPKLIR